MTETYNEYRLEWTYPYLSDQGKTEFSIGRSLDEARGNANKDEGYYWAGVDVGWSVRRVTVMTTNWEDYYNV